jgi:hypothetical protein
VSVLKSVKTETDDIDVGNTRSGVFRRVMARDLYDMTRRLNDLEERARNPFSTFLTAWPHIVLVLLLLVILFGNILYFGHRIDSIETLQREETLAQYAELESKQRMINELRQTIRQQADSMRAMIAASALTTAEPGTATTAVEDADAVPKRAPSSKLREPLPAFLGPGEVLLIVASTLAKEDAIDQARAFELDGYASEVILGKTGYYGIALGRFDFKQAKSMKSFMVETGVAKATPYLIIDESIDSYVYP